jgi:hypothetical protein
VSLSPTLRDILRIDYKEVRELVPEEIKSSV